MIIQAFAFHSIFKGHQNTGLLRRRKKRKERVCDQGCCQPELISFATVAFSMTHKMTVHLWQIHIRFISTYE